MPSYGLLAGLMYPASAKNSRPPGTKSSMTASLESIHQIRKFLDEVE